MALRGKTAEEQIYNFLIGKGMTPAGAAGLMGNLYAESGLKPTNIQNSYEKKLGFTDETYTAAVDSGAYGNFVNDSAGYGLAQWTYWSRKKALLEFAKARGASVGDLETQLEFLLHELNTGYAAVLSVLKTTGSVRAASDAVLLKFERPADQSTAAQERRAGYGQTYYNKYAAGAEKGQGTMTAKEKQNRANIVAMPVVGNVVRFTGAVHYASANANSGPACKPGTAKVTQLAPETKHPVHLIAQSGGGSTVYGWVDLADIQGATSAGTAPAPKMRVGARVKYSGPLYRDSNGNGQGKAVNGTYTVKYYYPGRKCGVHIDGLGWVPESACSVVG